MQDLHAVTVSLRKDTAEAMTNTSIHAAIKLKMLQNTYHLANNVSADVAATSKGATLIRQRLHTVEKTQTARHIPPDILGLLASTTPAAHLHSRVCLMHELKQLVHHSLEELPVLAQELGVLTNHIPGGQGAQQQTVQIVVSSKPVAANPWSRLTSDVVTDPLLPWARAITAQHASTGTETYCAAQPRTPKQVSARRNHRNRNMQTLSAEPEQARKREPHSPNKHPHNI
jgi:hypothetical protein